MPTISGHVYYNATNNLAPGVGIANVPVVLYSTGASIGAVALTDASGAFAFSNVPAGTFQLIEAWGAPGGIATPVDFAVSAIPMPVVPAEAEPPLTALPVPPPALADRLMALSPNLLNITVVGADITGLAFYDGPVGDQALDFQGISRVGPNLITAADNGTFGSYPPGQAANSTAPATPYPGVTPGFTYTTNISPLDGFYTVTNTTSAYDFVGTPWWVTSDHTTALETGRFMVVNGDNPGAIIFTQSVPVTPDKEYLVSAWIMNLIRQQTGFQLPRLGIRVWDQGGNLLVTQTVNPIPSQGLPVWYENGFLFNSGVNSSVTVQIVSEGLAAVGNDYVIDDISMFETQFINQLNAEKTMTPPIIYSQTGIGETVSVTVNVTNPTSQTINNVFFQDVLDPRLVFVPGSLTVNGSATAFDPNVGFSLGNMASGAVNTVEFAVTTTGGPDTIPNTAQLAYDAIVSGTGDIIRATFPTNTAEVQIVVNNAAVRMDKSVDRLFADFGDVLTYTLTLQNTGDVSASNVVITDAIPAGTAFIPGSVVGAVGVPPTLTLANPIPAGGTAVVQFQVQVGNAVPIPNPIPNAATADFTFTVDPANPDGESGTAASNTVNTQVNHATLTATKGVDKDFVQPGEVITYTLTLQNTGSAPADHVVITDAVPSGTTFVPGSLTGATGAPPTLVLSTVIPAGAAAVITYQVKVGNQIPSPNPVLNSFTADYTYTVDPSSPNGSTDTVTSNTTTSQVNIAKLQLTKRVDKAISYIDDIITYQIAVTNTGNVPASNVVITDPIPVGTVLVPGSTVVSVPYTPLPGGAIALTNPMAPGQMVSISFQVLVTAIPNPNPIVNIATGDYTYTVDPENPDGETGTDNSNSVITVVLRHNYEQTVTDLIESVAKEQAALANLANAEGAKIQRLVATGGATQQELLCLNQSVKDMLESITMLEAVLKQKLNAVSCQITGSCIM